MLAEFSVGEQTFRVATAAGVDLLECLGGGVACLERRG
jgi:hypothetical protein